MYVTDSLFFLQHLLGGGEHDENRQMFNSKLRDIIEQAENAKPVESAEEIRENMISKSIRLASGENI